MSIKKLILFLLYSVAFSSVFSQDSLFKVSYEKTLNTITNIIELNYKDGFRNAVYLVENTLTNSNIDYNSFQNNINFYTRFCRGNKITTKGYRMFDTANYKINLSLGKLFFDTTILRIDSLKFIHPPFRFNFTDPLGKKDITNTFVSKLLATHQGNCRSLTYLYKILADELGAKCWIALAPGHMYIKNYSQKLGWYNTELTSGTFPTDAYIMASSYINPTAVMSGMYMDTLSNQQAIALCVLDLAHLYERQTKNYYDGFILKCCDLVLKYHPVNPMALLLKAETLKKQAIREKSSKFPKLTATLKEMEQTYLKLFDLGYREMPYKMKKQKQKEEKENAEKYGNNKAQKINKN